MSTERAVLAAVILQEKEDMANLQECRALCAADGYTVVRTVTQRSRTMDPHTAFRSGKLAELKEACEICQADQIIFAMELSQEMAERIGTYCGVEVTDRTSLILDIFSRRARTKEARLQIALASMNYAMSREKRSVRENSGHASGSFRSRGGGEIENRQMRRYYRSRRAAMEKEIASLRRQKGADEKRRSKTLYKCAAIVGYTNAGKSSFLNAMMDLCASSAARSLCEDALFVTLDTSTRRLSWKGQTFFLYDTVGFVNHLPQALLDAFDSTLRAAADADLLVHVIDLSDPDWMNKADACRNTLVRIGAGEIPELVLYNKTDRYTGPLPRGICISCKDRIGIEQAADALTDALYGGEDEDDFLVPYDKMELFHAWYEVLRLTVTEEREDGMAVHAEGSRSYLEAFRHQLEGEEK